uniref:non-specific serine/threonine protein kinase n=1 Tax=Macrostomum lignano TaxID=282301 RepID=A0A1I8JPS7_9PLAT
LRLRLLVRRSSDRVPGRPAEVHLPAARLRCRLSVCGPALAIGRRHVESLSRPWGRQRRHGERLPRDGLHRRGQLRPGLPRPQEVQQRSCRAQVHPEGHQERAGNCEISRKKSTHHAGSEASEHCANAGHFRDREGGGPQHRLPAGVGPLLPARSQHPAPRHEAAKHPACNNGAVKLCDFGFARSMGINTMVLTSIKGSSGSTPLYMSPRAHGGEAIRSLCGLVALGCILYEIAYRKPAVLLY